jgi:serine/threonine protein kinase HipA of HipAB toxin-antitoxin module
MDDRDAGWMEYRRLILSELERVGREISLINAKIDRFRQEDLAQIKTDLALLKFQAGAWGAGGGILFGAIMTAVLRLFIK